MFYLPSPFKHCNILFDKLLDPAEAANFLIIFEINLRHISHENIPNFRDG